MPATLPQINPRRKLPPATPVIVRLIKDVSMGASAAESVLAMAVLCAQENGREGGAGEREKGIGGRASVR